MWITKKDHKKLNPPYSLSFGKQLWKCGNLPNKQNKNRYLILNKRLKEMWSCDLQKNSLHPNFTFIAGCRLGARVVCLGGGHKQFWWGTKIHSGLNAQKKSLSQMPPSGISPVAFFWDTIFARGTHSRLGAQNPALVRILPPHSGVKTKYKKGIHCKCTSVTLLLLFSFRAQFSFAWEDTFLVWSGTNSKLGGPAPKWPRGAGPAWMFLLKIYCIGFAV